MNLRLAFRNVFRNRWRSGLTMGGVAMAVALLVWMTCMMDAWMVLMVRAAVGVELGDAQVHTTEYVDEPGLFHAMAIDGGLLDTVKQTPGVKAATARVVAFGLLGHEKRSSVARLVGIDPADEVAVAGLDGNMVKGRWLSERPTAPGAPREAVLGRGLARLLEVEPGAELVLFLQGADGSLGNDVLEVVGVVATANSALDRLAVYAHREDVQYVTALDGKAHEIALITDEGHTPEAVVASLRERLLPFEAGEAGTALTVQSWAEIMPEFAAMVEFMDGYMWIMYLFIYFIAGLGILNTQRMSVLDRRREFGVLLAIGLAPGRLGRLVILETLVLTAVGALVGVLVGGAVVWHHSTSGFDMGMFTEAGSGSFSWMGISFDQVLYFRMTAAAVWQPLVVLAGVSFLCGLWPAGKAATLDAVRAISGRT